MICKPTNLLEGGEGLGLEQLLFFLVKETARAKSRLWVSGKAEKAPTAELA